MVQRFDGQKVVRSQSEYVEAYKILMGITGNYDSLKGIRALVKTKLFVSPYSGDIRGHVLKVSVSGYKWYE